MFPIKYIDNNLVWNKDNEVFAYYELIPYNYSFLSAEQKFIVHDSFRQLIAQSREGKIHALQIATESSIRSMQEQSKKLVTGKLKEVACQKIDEQTEALGVWKDGLLVRLRLAVSLVRWQVARFQTEKRQGTQPQKAVGAIPLPAWDSVQAQRWVLS